MSCIFLCIRLYSKVTASLTSCWLYFQFHSFYYFLLYTCFFFNHSYIVNFVCSTLIVIHFVSVFLFNLITNDKYNNNKKKEAKWTEISDKKHIYVCISIFIKMSCLKLYTPDSVNQNILVKNYGMTWNTLTQRNKREEKCCEKNQQKSIEENIF